MSQELFSASAIQLMNKRFPNIEKLSVFDASDLASDLAMASLSIQPIGEFSSRFGSKLVSASVNEKPCVLRYIDLTQNVETQADTLVYLTLLKSLRHSQLEDVSTIGLLEIGTGRNKDSKVNYFSLTSL